jgi:hypothetical protein
MRFIGRLLQSYVRSPFLNVNFLQPSGHQVIMDVISSIVIVIVYVVCLVNPIGITPVGIVPLFFSVAFCMSLVFGHRARTNNRKFYLPVGSIYQE